MSARNMAKRTAAGTLALAVCLGGGALALAGAAQADANFKFDTRIAGDDRYGTAIEASKAAFPEAGKTENVILVNGYATVDGLTASYLAGVANAPILYVSDKGADKATQDEIKRLGAKNVWLVGGEKVIPASVEAAIKADGYKVSRINGSDRYETAAMIAEKGTELAGKKPGKVLIASGEVFADALAVSPVAYGKHYPIILTDKDKTSDYSKKELGDLKVDTKILIGGKAVVSEGVEKDLTVTKRVAGDDRAQTANLVADWAKADEGFKKDHAILVGGTNGNGADSLVASAFAGKAGFNLHFAGWDATNVYLKDHAAELTAKGFVFGGKAAVPGDQVDKAQAAAQSVAAVTNYTVTRNVDGAKLWYADPSKKAAESITLTSDNVFFVDGNKATIGVFQAALSAGDLVSWSKDSSGVVTYKLVSKSADDYNSGIVGVVAGTNASIVEPVTNTPLNTVSFASGTYRVFTIDGSAVSQSIFASSVNVGDTITVTGDGSSASNIQTVALKNGSVTGAVTSWAGSGSTVSLLLETGAVVSVPVPLSTDTMTVDGKATSTVADVTGALSNGDKVSFAKSGGVASFALTNAAPPVANGQISSVTLLNGRLQTVTYIDAKTNASVPASNVTLAGSTYTVGTVAYNSTGPVAQVDTLTLSASPWKSTAYIELAYGSTPTYQEVAVGGSQATFMANLKTALEAQFSGRTVTVAQGSDDKTYTITWDTSAAAVSAVTVTGIGGVTYTVDGSLASVADVQSAITQGDVIAYQAQDVATGTKSSLALTNTGYSGSVNGAAVNTAVGTTALGVFSAGANSSTSLGTAVSYTSSSLLGLSGTPTYTVNGVSKTQAQFEAALGSIKAGGATGTVTLTQSGTKLVWALTVSVA